MAYYLSSNTSFGSNDIRLATDVSSLSTSDSWDTESASLNIPSNIASGTWYILFITDYQNQINESNENNNVEWIRITVNGNSNSGCIVSDNFDNYSNGSNVSSSNSAKWKRWSSSSPDGRVSRDRSFSGSQSMEINRGQYGRQDVVLKLGNKTRGIYKVSWNMYINNRDLAYFNIQNSENNLVSSGVFEILFEESDTDLQNRWFDLELFVDLDRNQMRLYFDNRRHQINRNFTANLGGINFYAVSDAHFYIDDICLQQTNFIPFISEEESRITSSMQGNLIDKLFSNPLIPKDNIRQKDLAIFPNPTDGYLNVALDLIAEEKLTILLFNASGQILKEINFGKTNQINHKLDMTNLSDGIYLIKIIGKDTAIIKRIALHK